VRSRRALPSDRVTAAIAAGALVLIAAGAYLLIRPSGPSLPGTAGKLDQMLRDRDECEAVETEETRRGEVTTAQISCGGLNGYIAYYRFPTVAARVRAVAGRPRFRRHVLYCVEGPQLVVNDLLGYDQTAYLCGELGFRTHHPPRPI
jgi:hypothetical protein